MANLRIGLKAWFRPWYVVKDGLRLLFKITPIRFFNLFINEGSLQLTRIFSKYVHWGKPWHLSVETASVCNLSCGQCACGLGLLQRNNSFLPKDDFELLLQKIPSSCFYLNMYFQGEPLLHPQLEELLGLAAKRGFYTEVATNAQLIDQARARKLVASGLNRIVISMDGTSDSDYMHYRQGGSLSKVLQAIGYLHAARIEANISRPLIVVQMLITLKSEAHISEFFESARLAGADMAVCKSMQIIREEVAHTYLPRQSAYSRYEKDSAGRFKHRKIKSTLACRRLWNGGVITSDGVWAPCCYDKTPDFEAGNLLNTSFAEIWNSARLKDFRKKNIKSHTQPFICKNCMP